MKNLSTVFLVFAVISVVIALYQFIVDHYFEGILSLVYTVAFLFGAYVNRYRQPGHH
ncbi:hypothetical protein [Fulvivirga sedimenti]|uniref:Uncharacterized protein n=1 Tax=Fulvivirga sedimenti TaxID=2879465 RepID=A0A9X1KVJ8_9BACT|nr:hypothetical protein [Fulvivirga sedimenti]MCA6073775.1 hypothetical protein [Fulvivirga sedimenti]